MEPEIFAAFDRCTYNVLLYISSPGIKLGRFYDAFTEHRDQFILTAQVGLTDCPHISKERIDDVIATYGADKPFTSVDALRRVHGPGRGGAHGLRFPERDGLY